MTISELLELVVWAAPSGVLVFDSQGSILFANPMVEQMFGHAPGELRGTALDAFAPEILESSHSERVATFRKEQARGHMPPSLQLLGRRRDGTGFPIDVRLLRATLQGQPVVLCSVVDATERQVLHDALVDRNAFEQVVAEIAASFVTTSDAPVNEQIVESQRRLSALLGFERSAVWKRVGDDFKYSVVWSSDFPSSSPPALFSAAAHFPWATARLKAGEIVSFERVEDLPASDREACRRFGAKSGVAVPLLVQGELVGLLTFTMLSCERAWSPYFLARLPLIAAVFSNSLARKQARDALEEAHLEVEKLKELLAIENVQLRSEVRALKGPRMLSLESVAARQVFIQIQQVAPTTATVLMLGETGSGKEAFAEALHELSPRRSRPMVRINCGAIPSALVESELFGRERGAYTGALSRQIGRFEAADGSTIFLDEVGDLPLETQVKLLRVLQDHVIERLGSAQSIKVNVRIVAATNRDLEQAVADRTFREDLYYRLNVFPIRVPPLRERVEDIPALTWSFISEFSDAFGKNIESLSKASLEALQAYAWPGNVRELRNVVERAVIVANGRHLVIAPPRPSTILKRKSIRIVDVEADHIRSVLDSTGWRIRGHAGAADLLGIKPTTLESRMSKLGIARHDRQH